MKAKIFLSSILTIALCLSLIVGSTFALFTKTETVNIAVTAGKVNVVASVIGGADFQNGVKKFENGGTATIVGGNELKISKMTPGDSVTFTIQVANHSNVKIGYKVSAQTALVDNKADLMGALKCTATINGTAYKLGKIDGVQTTTISMPKHAVVDAPEKNGDLITNITVTVEFPANDSTIKYNDFQEAAAKITFLVEAVQGNEAN